LLKIISVSTLLFVRELYYADVCVFVREVYLNIY